MKRIKHILLATIMISLFTFSKSIDHKKFHQQTQKASYSWQRTDSTFALQNNGKTVWQLNFNKKQDKPYFYPLRVNGYDLALERPADHPWHRGLWFSWKYINHVNYWEENPKNGYSKGRSKIVNVAIATKKNYSAIVHIDLEYGEEGKEKLLSEQRTLRISPVDKAGNYLIDWELKFKAGDSLLVLDRSLPLKRGGKIFWGYAGLSYRASENLTKHVFQTSAGWNKQNSFTGEPGDADWMDMSAVLDEQTRKEGGITIFDHPDNPRHPSPWYVWFEEGKHAFFTPAILYNEPLKLAPHKSIQLNYRVYLHSGRPDVQNINEIYRRFHKGKR